MARVFAVIRHLALDTLFRSVDYATQSSWPRRRVFRGTAAVSLKLYYHPLSTFSRRVLIAFAEKQIPHELAVVLRGGVPESFAWYSTVIARRRCLTG
jgi:hypothetical protein